MEVKNYLLHQNNCDQKRKSDYIVLDLCCVDHEVRVKDIIVMLSIML